MAKASSRVMLNRSALTRLGLGLANGVEEIVRTIVEDADPPDAPPFGVGLAKRGGWAVYQGSKKVGGGSMTGAQPKKPRDFKAAARGITGIAGFGFPGRFQETGTVNHAAQPFLWPAAMRVLQHAGAILKDSLRGMLR